MQWYEKLKFAREIKGLTIRDVEKAVRISNAYISQLENGKIKEPGFFIMLRLINFLGLGVHHFATEAPTINYESNIGPEVRCLFCGAGDINHHSYTCPTGLHPDKRAEAGEGSEAAP